MNIKNFEDLVDQEEESLSKETEQEIEEVREEIRSDKPSNINFLDLLVNERPYIYKLKKYRFRKIPHETMNYEVDDQSRMRNSTAYAKNDKTVLQSLSGSSKNASLRTFIKRKNMENELYSRYKSNFEKEELKDNIVNIKYPVEIIEWEKDIIYDTDSIQQTPFNENTVTSEFVNTILEDNWERYIIYDEADIQKYKPHTSLFLEDPNLIFERISEKRDQKSKKKHKEIFTGDKPLKGKYNISNDKFYTQEQKTKNSLGNYGVQHSVPALRLDPLFYRNNFTREELRKLHRFPLEYSKNVKYTFKKIDSNKVTVSNIIRKASELNLKDGQDFSLFEYSEEYPFFVVNSGMVSLLNTYYRKTSTRDDYAVEHQNINILDLEDPSPFFGFGDVKPGTTLKVLTNNLFIAPIFRHTSEDIICCLEQSTDKSHKIYFRNIDSIYCVGQEFPLEEIFAPHSRKLNIFSKNRLKVAAYRLFNSRNLGYKEFKMSQIDKMFPYFSEGSKRKWLKEYADCVKRGKENVWALKPTSSLLTEEDLRKLITPENICQYESMLAGERRMEDFGYKYTEDNENEDDEESNEYPAPWQLCRNFINACNGRGLLELCDSTYTSGLCDTFSFRKLKLTKGNETENRKIISEHQAKYSDLIEKIWNKQLTVLGSVEDIPFEKSYLENTSEPKEKKLTEPQSETTAFSDSGNYLIIKRQFGFGEDARFETEKIIDPNLIKLYLKAKRKQKSDDRKTILKCGSCGQPGHTKTSKLCSQYTGTRKHTKKVREAEKRKAKLIFQEVILPLISKLMTIPYSTAFHRPVSLKLFPDYTSIVETPIDLTTIKTKVRHNKYTKYSEFVDDLKLMHSNCIKYNGEEHSLTKIAANMINVAEDEYEAKKNRIVFAEEIFVEYADPVE